MVIKYKSWLTFLLCAVSVGVGAFGATRTTSKKQNAIDLGTKVADATEMKSNSCAEKYAMCMDAGCIIDNDSGGRCQCSDKIKDLNTKFEKLRIKGYKTDKLASLGKEIVEMGEYQDELLGAVSNDNIDEYEEPDLDVSGAVGEDLRNEMHDLCIEKMPECKSQLTLIKNMYSQKIKSDCVAFENALTVQNQQNKERRADAKKAIRSAALEQYQASNKYDLGQCTIEFGKCMQTTAECGKDWSGCVGTLGIDKMYTNSINRVTIKGANSSVQIAKSTIEILENKKIICESVTQQCVAVKDKVWDAFLKNSIAEIKSAESLAESNARSSCLTNISNCFLNACKDNIDDKNPDSYDLCLSHPATMKNLCKVELEPCLAATGGSYNEPEKSTLWPAVLAKLSSMRVDACTDEFKKCLQSEDRCGKDYSNCIGLDNEDVANICPEEKLVACYKEYNGDEEKVRDSLARIAQGIFLNVDNELLTACENAVSDAMIKVCGSEDSCDDWITPETGTKSLRLVFCERSGDEYTNCKLRTDAITDVELGRITRDKQQTQEINDRHDFEGVVYGEILWNYIDVADDLYGISDTEKYFESVKSVHNLNDMDAQNIKSELDSMNQVIKRVIDMIEMEPRVQYCMNGRKLESVIDNDKFKKLAGKTDNPRFPNLTNKHRRKIINMAIDKVRSNYYGKYDKLFTDKIKGEYEIATRIAEIENKNQKENIYDRARAACVALGMGRGLADYSYGAFSKEQFGYGRHSDSEGLLTGISKEEGKYYIRSVETNFDMNTGVCNKCVKEKKCTKKKNKRVLGMLVGGLLTGGFVGAIFAGGDIGAQEQYTECAKWSDETEECSDIQF